MKPRVRRDLIAFLLEMALLSGLMLLAHGVAYVDKSHDAYVAWGVFLGVLLAWFSAAINDYRNGEH